LILTVTIGESQNIKGDLNLDGQVKIADALLLQRYLLGDASLTEAQYNNADINDDADVDSFDMVFMKKMLIK